MASPDLLQELLGDLSIDDPTFDDPADEAPLRLDLLTKALRQRDYTRTLAHFAPIHRRWVQIGAHDAAKTWRRHLLSRLEAQEEHGEEDPARSALWHFLTAEEEKRSPKKGH